MSADEIIDKPPETLGNVARMTSRCVIIASCSNRKRAIVFENKCDNMSVLKTCRGHHRTSSRNTNVISCLKIVFSSIPVPILVKVAGETGIHRREAECGEGEKIPKQHIIGCP